VDYLVTGRAETACPGKEQVMKLQDLKIVVSGAGSGMGRHFAQRLSEAGATVAIGDVNEQGLAETLQLCAGVPGRVHSRRFDVSSEADVAAFVEWAWGAMGGLNALVNNAGIIRDGLLVKKDRETGEVKKLTKEQWDAVIGVNLTGAALLARDIVAKMVTTGTRPGVVVNISSVARHGCIRCGAIAPGMVETPMTRGMNQKARDALVAAVPVGRIGEPEDLWLAVKFVLECDYFNARTVDVDGGLVM
jgi:3-oxoacyl-[acyl-carrier protein] reductase